jgi:predicted outer membrane protein
MRFLKSLALSVALPAVSPSTFAAAQHADAKPIDAQIAQLAYAAGQINLKEAELAYRRALASMKLKMAPPDNDFVASSDSRLP